MGKSYYCEYCNKRMKFSVNIRKNHNDGLPHKIARANYMARFRDPREILATELNKTPCSRFLSGKECKYAMVCNFTHYTSAQLKDVEKIVYRLDHPLPTTSKSLPKEDPAIQIFPWKYPQEHIQKINASKDLPPSLQPYNIEKYLAIKDDVGNEWGLENVT